jgi:hypothetical protein
MTNWENYHLNKWKNEMEATHYFKQNGIEHKILANLARDDYPSNAIAKRLGVKSVHSEMYELTKKRLVRQTGLDYFTLTNEGLDVYHQLGVIHDQTPRRRSANREWMTAGKYTGAELRDTCLRDGAYDYREHPSMTGNGTMRVWLGHGNRVIKTESVPRQ